MKKQLFISLISFLVSITYAQMWIGSIVSPESACNLACENIKIVIGYNGGQVFSGSQYSVSYKINGVPISGEEYPGTDLFSGAASSVIYTFNACYNFNPDAIYDLQVCIKYNDGSGFVELDCKNKTIESNAPVTPGNIIAPPAICEDLSGNGTDVSATLSAYFGTVEDWYFKNTSTGNNFVAIGDNDNNAVFPGLNEVTEIMVVLSNNYCPNDTTYFSLGLNTPPEVGTLFNDTVLCKTNNNMTFFVNSADGVEYIWESSLNNALYTPVNGAPNNDSLIDQVVNISTYFRLRVRNLGCLDEVSNTVFVEVVDDSYEGDVSISDTAVCVNDHSVLVQSVNAITDSYFWEYSYDGSNWLPHANAFSAFTENNLTEDVYYRLTAQHSICPEVVSDVLFVRVDDEAVSPSLTGGNVFCMGANSGSIEQQGVGVGSLFSFEVSNDSINWTDTPFNGSLPFTNLTNTHYYRLIYESGVCPNDTSNVEKVQLDPFTVPGLLENDSLICTGNNGELNLSAYTGEVVKWQSKSINAGTWTDINNTDDFHLFQNLTDTTLFRVVVKSGVCEADTSNIITLDYVLGPDPGLVSSDGRYCIDNVNHLMEISNYNGSVVTWEGSVDGVTFYDEGVSTDAFFANGITETHYYRVALELNNCPIVYSDTIEVKVDPLSQPGVLSEDTTFCDGDAVYYATVTNYLDTVLAYEISLDAGSSWLPYMDFIGDTLFYNLNTTSRFRATVKSGVCPEVKTNEVKVIVNPNPQVEAGPNQVLFADDPFYLDGFTDAINYIWTPQGDLDDPSVLNPTGIMTSNHRYYLVATNDYGCTAIDSVMLMLMPPDPQFDTITNLITVNNDGYNDFWVVKGIERYPNNHVLLYDKWGREVFAKDGYTNDFDGKSLPDGDYFYLIYFDDFEKKYKGVLKISKY